jgi:hypothetical protein
MSFKCEICGEWVPYPELPWIIAKKGKYILLHFECYKFCKSLADDVLEKVIEERA